jgi:hypothetical protein
MGVVSHGELNGEAFRVPSDKIIVVLTVPGAFTYCPISLYVMHDPALIEDAVRGRLRLFGQRVYTRTFLPGEKMANLRLRFTENPTMMGVFSLPLPSKQGGARTAQEVAHERAALDDTDMMHTFDPRYVPGRYTTTLRTIMHRHTPPGIYILSSCRNWKGDADRLPEIQAINFTAPFQRFVQNDTKRSSRRWPPRTAAHIKEYHDGLQAIAQACERSLRRRASYV